MKSLLLTLSLVLPSLALGQKAPDIYKMRWVLAHEPIRVFERAARHFAEEVKRETNGHVLVEIVNSKALNGGNVYSPDQVIRLMKDGKIEMSQTYTTWLGNYDSTFWALDLPFLFRDHEHVAKVLDGPVGTKVMSGLQASNLTGLAFTYSGGYMITPTSDKAIHSVDDFKGLRILINNNSPVATALMKSLGADPIALDDRVVLSPQVDGLETTYARLQALPSEARQKGKFLNETSHRVFLTTILINKKFFENLPVKYQTAIRNSARVAARLEREDSIRDGEQAKQEYRDKGYQIVAMTPKEVARFKAASKPVYKKFELMFGKDLIQDIVSQ